MKKWTSLQPFFCRNNVQKSFKNLFDVVDYQPVIRSCGPPRFYRWEQWRVLLLKCVSCYCAPWFSKLSLSWWNSEKHKTYVLLTFCTLSELRHTLAVSSPSQGRRNQGLLDMETLPCSLLGKRSASRILLLGMALTTALGKYKKEERLNIPSAAANPSHKKVELEATFRGYPVFFPPPFIPSTFICSCACCDSSQFTQTGRITLRVKEADA